MDCRVLCPPSATGDGFPRPTPCLTVLSMTTQSFTVPSPLVQRARGLLAELAELGTTWLDADAHRDVLLAFDALESAGAPDWPPPPGPFELGDVRAALNEVRRALSDVLASDAHHGLDPGLLGLAVEQVARVLWTWP